MNGDALGKVIYNGLVGIAFKTQEKNNLEVTKFINVQNHREWINAVIYGKKQASSQKSISVCCKTKANPKIIPAAPRTTALSAKLSSL